MLNIDDGITDFYNSIDKMNAKYSKDHMSKRQIKKNAKILKRNIAYKINFGRSLLNSLNKAFGKFSKNMSSQLSPEAQRMVDARRKELGLDK